MKKATGKNRQSMSTSQLLLDSYVEGPDPEESSQQVFQAVEPEDQTLKLGDQWTRVISRDQTLRKSLASYPIGQDIQVDVALRSVLHEFNAAKGKVLFRPNDVGMQKEEMQLALHTLPPVRLMHYAQVASSIRRTFHEKASSLGAEETKMPTVIQQAVPHGMTTIALRVKAQRKITTLEEPHRLGWTSTEQTPKR
jgi:hypothetical protein